MKKWIAMMAAVLLAVSALAGCGDKTTGGAESKTASAAENNY